MLGKLKKFILFGLAAATFFSAGSLGRKETPKPTYADDAYGVCLAPDNDATYICQAEDFTTSNLHYATKSRGNTAYLTIYVFGYNDSTVTINYHTENGSAVVGVDYTDINSGSVTVARGSGTRSVKIAVETKMSTLSLTGYKNKDFTSRSLFVSLDRAYLDNGTEIAIVSKNISHAGRTVNAGKKIQVFTLANNSLSTESYGSYYRLLPYTYRREDGYYIDEMDYDTTISGLYFSLTNDDMETAKKLGLADYFVTASCTLGEPQDSSEETTRFIFGNERWWRDGGCSYATRGTGWFLGCEIKYNCTYIGDSAISDMIARSSWAYSSVATYDIDNNNVAYCPDDYCYYFRNIEGSGMGFSVYRHYACDGEIPVRVRVYERCIDFTAPTVSNVYLDTSNIFKSEGKFRLSVRFSEPVQCGEGTKIMAETNTSTYLDFDYAGGNGTDTLYYDCDTTKFENVKISKLSFNNTISTNANSGSCFINFRNIRDMYGNTLDKIGMSKKDFTNVSLDKRIPKLSVDEIYASSNVPKKSPTVAISLNDFTSGTVYYAWVKKEDEAAYLGGYPANSFEIVNKLIGQSRDSTNPLTGSIELTNESSFGDVKTQVLFDYPEGNGEYYLYCYCEPAFSITNIDNIKVYRYGTYLVDNTKPLISDMAITLNPKVEGGFSRKFTFHVADQNGVDSVTAYVKESGKKNAKVNSYSLSVGDEGDVSFSLDLVDLINRFYTDSEGRVTVNQDSGRYDVNFEVRDKAGNVATAFADYETYYLSTLPYFQANKVPLSELNTIVPDELYSVGATFCFTHNDTNLQDELLKFSVNDSEYIDDLYETDEYEVYYNGGNAHRPAEGQKCIGAVKFYKPGYYTVKIECAGSYSDEFHFYITDDCKEETTNYKDLQSNEIVLTNKVFQLSENVQFMFINSSRQIERERYGGTSNPTFSSETAALNFLKYYEYQDLKYEVLTSNTASYLNTGSGEGYNKAQGENRIATSGQVWIRYKRANSWNVNSESVNDWAYYFYSDEDDGSDTIDVELLSENLKSAINTVCKKICDRTGTIPNAGDVYLVNDEHLNPRTRAPYLSEEQIALSRPQIFKETKTGSKLENAGFAGDPNLFDSFIRKDINGTPTDLAIATNYQFEYDQYTKIYIAPYVPGVDPSFVEVKLREGITLKEAILTTAANGTNITATSNIYVIRELDANGARDYYVYVDLDAPLLGRELNDSGVVEYMDSREIANLFANKLVLKSVGNGYDDGGNVTYTEIDKYAYVALFKMPGQSLYAIYYNGEIPDENIEEGTYLVCVGDRSGNVYTFYTYISNSLPKVTFKPGDTKFTISIDNRSLDELQSVEIYCNDVLVSSKLAITQTFTQNGEYKVVIVDKYGNEYTETQAFTREQPKIDFYYDEANDGYFTKYKEGNTDYMIITPGEDYTTVSTSRRVKIAINSDECEFAIYGLLPSEYTYNEETHEIIVSTTASFYIDIWNSISSEDIQSYRVVVDNNAPTISVTTDDRKLTFDETNANDYSNGDYSNPDSIKYTTSNNLVEVIVLQDDVISNDYVNVKVNDETGIKDIKVYQNDVLVATYTQDDVTDEQISFHIGNKQGTVKIVATDLFNNSTAYLFNFEDKSASSATIDGHEMDENLTETYYGNDVVVVTCDPYSEIHLQYEYNGEVINEVYRYYNGSLYVGEYKYVPGSDAEHPTIYGQVDYYNGGMLTTDEYGNDIYVDKPVTLDVTNTYKPHEDLELYLVCDPETGEVKVILEATNVAQKVDIRVNESNTVADYYSFELSKETGKLIFSSSSGSVLDTGNRILTNTDDIDILYSLDNITEIVVAYNPISNDFTSDSFIYTLDNMFENGEGYYTIRVTNKYGNVAFYNLIYSNSINASIELSYDEKVNEIFTVNYADNFYTNDKAKIVGYNLSTLEAVTESGEVISGTAVDDMMILELEESATVTIRDIYGNEKIIHLVVGSDNNFKYDTQNEWITGFNELANKEAGYTNQELSIGLDENEIIAAGITQIRVECDGEVTTVYGYDGLSFVAYDEELLTNCIGSNGTNVYKVIFANKYGDIVVKEIHYSEESTLVITRQTSSSVYEETIDIDDALDNGVWSNREINLSSSLDDNSLYTFYIKSDGDTEYREVSLPYILQLASTSQNGTLKYFIKYVDAYGYSHEIACTLNRQDIETVPIGMDFTSINQVDFTKDPIKFVFNDDVTAVYSLNNSEEVAYTSGETLYLDGDYTFKFMDISGNMKTIVFTKDSTCRFQIATPSGDVVAYNGGVINASQLDFNSMGDSSRIVYVLFNGELIEVDEYASFTKSGHYELIIEDGVGNTAYFHFYLMNHSTSEFVYEVPENYEISEVYRTNNGVRTPYMDAVDSTKTKLVLTQDGSYDIVLKNIYQDSTTNFSIEINNDLPAAKLVGCDENSVTTNDISLKDVAVDDIIEIYKDGELVARYDETSDNMFKSITEGGKYRIVVTNAQGVSKELCFTKKNIANTSLSILIIVGCIVVSGGFFIGLLLRNRSKFDE